MFKRLLLWAEQLKAQIVALWFCYRHPHMPLIAKLLAVAVVAYAFSPIDLIPDFIPILGLLDDAILLPIGVWLALKLIPKEIFDESREKAAQWIAAKHNTPRNWIVAVIVGALWVAAAWLCWRWFFP